MAGAVWVGMSNYSIATLAREPEQITIWDCSPSDAERLGRAVLDAASEAPEPDFGALGSALRASWSDARLVLTGDLDFAIECLSVALDVDPTLPDVYDLDTGTYVVAPTLAQGGVP